MLEEFIDLKLLNTALKHSSFDAQTNYEKLELLGDAVLLHELNKILLFQNLSTKEINTKQQLYLSTKHLAYCAKKLQLTILTGNSLQNEQKALSDRLYANIMESVVASIYLKGQKLSEFCKKHIFFNIEQKQLLQCTKIELQNLCMKLKFRLPKYITKLTYDNIFTTYCIVATKTTKQYTHILITQSVGNTKKSSHKISAKYMLKTIYQYRV